MKPCRKDKMSNDYQVSQEKEDNDKECSECGGEPYPKVWWRTVSNSPDYNTASPDITNMNEELTSEIVEKIIPIIEKYLAQAQQEAVQTKLDNFVRAVKEAGLVDVTDFQYFYDEWREENEPVS